MKEIQLTVVHEPFHIRADININIFFKRPDKKKGGEGGWRNYNQYTFMQREIEMNIAQMFFLF